MPGETDGYMDRTDTSIASEMVARLAMTGATLRPPPAAAEAVLDRRGGMAAEGEPSAQAVVRMRAAEGWGAPASDPVAARSDRAAEAAAPSVIEAGDAAWSAAVLRRRLQIVETAERLALEASPCGTLPLYRLCERVGVSERALRMAFVTIRGVSPWRALRDHRLDRVRALLRAAPERPSAVKQAAMGFGFWHLGRFSHHYQERFGELPSATVARALAERGMFSGEAVAS